MAADVRALYQELAEVPEVVAGYLQPSPLPRSGGDAAAGGKYTAVIDYSQADLTNNVKLTMRSSFVIDDAASTQSRYSTDFPQEVPARVKQRVPSPTAQRLALVTAAPSGSVATCIEIYSSDRRVCVYDGREHHGAIYTSGPFAGVSWCADEQYLAFVAEAKSVVGQSFFGKALPGGAKAGSEYEAQEDFGERLEGVRCPTIFVINASTGHLVANLANRIPDGWTVGEPVWCPGKGRDIVLTAMKTYTRKLGMVFYTTRPSSLMHVKNVCGTGTPSAEQGVSYRNLKDVGDAEDDPTMAPMARILTDTQIDQAARSPRFSPDNKTLMWVSCHPTHLHGSSSMLRIMHWPPTFGKKSEDDEAPRFAKAKTVVDQVRDSKVGAFPGLFLPASLPAHIWLGDSSHVVLQTSWRSRTTLVLIDITTGAVTDLEVPHAEVSKGGELCYQTKLLDVLVAPFSLSLEFPRVIPRSVNHEYDPLLPPGQCYPA
jgi:hypothetical protein